MLEERFKKPGEKTLTFDELILRYLNFKKTAK